MKYNVYLLNYNNYYNRQVKKLDTINDYIQGGYQLNTTVENINFVMGDGLSSELIINQSYISNQPDYCLIEERHEANEPSVFSRWFIIDSDLTRGGQYHFTVKRDICADFYDMLLDSTYFVKRGYVKPTDKLIFNDEGQKYSQIKKSQTKLYDRTECPWIVGYIPRSSGEDGILADNDKQITTTAYTGDIANFYAPNGIANWTYYQYGSSNKISSEDTYMPYQVIYKFPVQNNVNGNTMKYEYLGISVNYTKHTFSDEIFLEAGATQYQTGVFSKEKTQSQFNSLKDQYHFWYEATPRTNSAIQLLDCGIADRILQATYTNTNSTITKFRNVLGRYRTINESLYTELQGLAGKTVLDQQTNKIYTIVVHTDNEDYGSWAWSSQLTTYEQDLYDALYDMMPGSFITTYGNTVAYGYAPTVYDKISIYRNYKTCYLTFEEIGSTISTYIPKDDSSGVMYRTHLIDAPYDMFAIPYGELTIRTGANTYVTTNKSAGLSMACAMITELGAEFVYDLQLLPYCPVQDYIKSDGTFDIREANQTQVREITASGTTTSFIFYCKKSEFSIPVLSNKTETYGITITNVKKQYNTEMYRLCSPNFSSTFEFNPAQNGGVDYFSVTATYKPFTPYIRIHPKFNSGWMYGGEFEDCRGLILQGDFSLPKVTSAWTEYELQNKNYLNIFNREIQSMNLQDKVASQNDVFGAISGVLTGAVSGGVGGYIAGGNSFGAGIAGAAIGTGLAAVGGAMDIVNNQSLRNDAISKAQSNFTWSMENIKALPYSLANVSALNIDNALVPLLEFYQASDEEINAFEQKMRFYGMSVMCVSDTLTRYLNPTEETFIQADLIRLNKILNISEEADNHFAKALSDEVQKGLYIGG